MVTAILLCVWVFLIVYPMRLMYLNEEVEQLLRHARTWHRERPTNFKADYEEMEEQLMGPNLLATYAIVLIIVPIFFLTFVALEMLHGEYNGVVWNPFLRPKLKDVKYSSEVGRNNRTVYYYKGIYLVGCSTYRRRELVKAIKSEYELKNFSTWSLCRLKTHGVLASLKGFAKEPVEAYGLDYIFYTRKENLFNYHGDNNISAGTNTVG